MEDGVDEGEVGERLGEVAEVLAALWVDLLAVQLEGSGEREQLRAELARLVELPDLAQCRDQPEGADREGALLAVDGLVLRYKVEETDDGLKGEEGTFAICSFWLVSALAEIGEHRRARELCEKMLSYASPLQLYAEEIDARTGRHLGNFPQAFTHLAQINAIMHVIRADHSEDTRQFSRAR